MFVRTGNHGNGVDRTVPEMRRMEECKKFDLNRCDELPLHGEKPDFWPVSKNNTGNLPLRGNPAGKNGPELQTWKMFDQRTCSIGDSRE